MIAAAGRPAVRRSILLRAWMPLLQPGGDNRLPAGARARSDPTSFLGIA